MDHPELEYTHFSLKSNTPTAPCTSIHHPAHSKATHPRHPAHLYTILPTQKQHTHGTLHIYTPSCPLKSNTPTAPCTSIHHPAHSKATHSRHPAHQYTILPTQKQHTHSTLHIYTPSCPLKSNTPTAPCTSTHHPAHSKATHP